MKYAVSVIIPVYNNIKEIELTLNSLYNQTFPLDKVEVIIADDGSREDIKGCLDKHPRLNIKYFYQEDRGFRPGAARNMGIRNADGDLCLFIDAGVLLEK
ncbi:MAG: glycosyltransferase, partial [Spirochaetaceae bacterium]|nr:glycosyltransferase [Spirochaetaceae bacterium]